MKAQALQRLDLTYDPERLKECFPDSFENHGDSIFFEPIRWTAYIDELLDELDVRDKYVNVCASYNPTDLEWHAHDFAERNIILPVQGESYTYVDEFYDPQDLEFNPRYGYTPTVQPMQSCAIYGFPGTAYILDTAVPHMVRNLTEGPRYCIMIQLPPEYETVDEYIKHEEEDVEDADVWGDPHLTTFKEV